MRCGQRSASRPPRQPKLRPVDLVAGEPNVQLRTDAEGREIVVLAFPYDARIVDAARRIPGRRFDWDRREWWAIVDDWVGAHVADILARFPELEPSDEAAKWLRGIGKRWIGTVGTQRHDGRGWFVLRTRAGELPEPIAAHAEPVAEGIHRAPLDATVAAAIIAEKAARPDGAAVRCLSAWSTGWTCRRRGSSSRATWTARGSGSTCCGTTTPARRSSSSPARRRAAGCRWTRGSSSRSTRSWACTGPRSTARPGRCWRSCAAEHDEAAEVDPPLARDRGRADRGRERLGGTLEPFQWAGVRYALDARRCFIADEQGLGKTVEALAALEADDAFPAVVVCPASLKLNWEREAARWLPHRTTTLVAGQARHAARRRTSRSSTTRSSRAHREALARRRAAARSCSTSRTRQEPARQAHPGGAAARRRAADRRRCGSR